jgi:asparagine synthase (glutamine-hydrolysing)
MCGICGIYIQGNGNLKPEILERMGEALAHRGPDGKGQIVDRTVGLGHRRLSIIDLKGGAQPMENVNGNIVIIFNGEIYNYIELREELKTLGHIFKTESDTEVILHGYEEWGENCTNHFNGIFAFAIYNRLKNELFLARDHLGVKPLYYQFTTEGEFVFASEIKALLVHPSINRGVNLQSLAELFTYRYVPSPETLFDGIKKLPPGHQMVISENNCKIRKYWRKYPEVNYKKGEKQFIKEYQELFENAVKIQLRSDVPVGLFLSEGVDSASLLALMSKYSNYPIKTFTIGFDGGEKTSELAGARGLSKLFGSEHHEMILSPDDYINQFNQYIFDIEEPVGNETAAAFYFVSNLASKEVKVVLSGQGADEPWAGYDRHLGAKLSVYYAKLPKIISNALEKLTYRYLPRNEKIKRAVSSLSEADIAMRFVNIYSFFNEQMKRDMFLPHVQKQLGSRIHSSHYRMSEILKEVENEDILNKMLYLDTRTNLPDDLLMVGDKTSMVNSLEMRVPYLDHRLVELVETIPSNLKIRGLSSKYLHKKALKKWLPKEVVSRKKKGFANPINNWLRTRMSQYLGDHLLSQDAAVHKYFNKKYIENIYRLHLEGREEHLRHLYLLLSFEVWHKKFIERK